MSSTFYNSSNEMDDVEIISLVDEENRSLECYVERSLEIENQVYLLLEPVDIPVMIVACEEDDDGDGDFSNVYPIEGVSEVETVFADAKAVLAELDLQLKHTAFTLTASGELPPLDEIVTLELDSNEESLEPEDLQFLASFYCQEQKHSIFTHLDPLLFLATVNALGELELVSPDDEDVRPILEELLFDEEE